MSVQFSVLLYCWVWLCAAEVNPGLGPVTHRIRSFSSSLLTGIAPLLSSSQELLFPVLWQEIWAFLGVLAVSATIMQFYMNRMFLEVHKTLREKRKKKITRIPHSTSRAVLRAELGEKRGQTNRNKHTNKKQRIPSIVSALQVTPFLFFQWETEVSLRVSAALAHCAILRRGLPWIRSGTIKRN